MEVAFLASSTVFKTYPERANLHPTWSDHNGSAHALEGWQHVMKVHRTVPGGRIDPVEVWFGWTFLNKIEV